MRLETFTYATGRGFSDPLPGDLDSPCTLVVAFGSSAFIDAPGPFRALRTAFPRSHLVGCSTAGEIIDAEVRDGSIVVAVLSFEGVRLASTTAPIAMGDASFAAGERIARDLLAPDLRGVLVLSDGLDVNGSELVRGVNSALPASVLVTGGLAADGDRFRRTWVLRDGVPTSGQVSAVGFYGDLVRLGHGSNGGWDIFGPERRITRSEGNVLYELDGKPALELYKSYLGERAAGLPATALLFPLAVRASEHRKEQVVRTILAVDEASQSLTFAGDVPVGALAQLMRANFDRLIQGAAGAATQACDLRCGGDAVLGARGPVLSIAISCVGRRLVLGERTEEEIESTLEALPRGSRQVGFYSYGELSPHPRSATGPAPSPGRGGQPAGRCDLHNQTMTLSTIGEG